MYYLDSVLEFLTFTLVRLLESGRHYINNYGSTMYIGFELVNKEEFEQ